VDYEIYQLKDSDIDNKLKDKFSVWTDAKLLDCYAKRDGIDYNFLCVLKNNIIKAIMPIFEYKKYRLKYTHNPSLYPYTPINFYIDEEHLYDQQHEKLLILKVYAEYLKKSYKKVDISFMSEINDVRAFTWSGFEVQPLYTLVKTINNYNLNDCRKDLKKNLQKAIYNGLKIVEQCDTDIIYELTKELVNKRNISANKISGTFLQFYQDLINLDYCSCHFIYNDKDDVLNYKIIIKDEHKSTIYTLMTGNSSEGLKSGANVFYFDYLLKNNSSYDYLDFVGANYENISNFKTQFNCELINYFHIKKKIDIKSLF
jgi:hypothetical protein